MAFKDGAAQIIKLIPTRLALIALPMGLMRVKAALGNLRGGAGQATETIGPASLANRFIAFRIIKEGLNIHQHGSLQFERMGQSYRKSGRLLETPNKPKSYNTVDLRFDRCY